MAQVAFLSADPPEPRLTCACGRGAAGRVQLVVLLDPCPAASRSRPPYFLQGRQAGGRAEPGQVGSAGGCAAGGRDAPWAPAAPRLPHLAAPAASPHYLGPACVHVTSLGVRAGVRPWVLSTLPPAPTPASFLRLSLGSSASSRKPSERARACGNLFAEGRPHPLHSLQQATSEQP